MAKNSLNLLWLLFVMKYYASLQQVKWDIPLLNDTVERHPALSGQNLAVIHQAHPALELRAPQYLTDYHTHTHCLPVHLYIVLLTAINMLQKFTWFWVRELTLHNRLYLDLVVFLEIYSLCRTSSFCSLAESECRFFCVQIKSCLPSVMLNTQINFFKNFLGLCHRFTFT